MRTITLLNEKGGVGKTTLAVTLAAGLARLGAKVLLLDADAQGSAGLSLGVAPRGSLYRLLAQDVGWDDPSLLVAVAPEKWGGDAGSRNLVMLPSDVQTGAIPMVVADLMLLGDRLDEVNGNFDFCIIDTNPTPSFMHTLAYMATDYMVYPTQAEFLSLRGLGETMMHLDKLQRNRKNAGFEPVSVMGIQTNLMTNTDAHKTGYSALVNQFGELAWPAISQRTAWREAGYRAMSIFPYAEEIRTDSAFAAMQDAIAFVERVIAAGVA